MKQLLVAALLLPTLVSHAVAAKFVPAPSTNTGTPATSAPAAVSAPIKTAAPIVSAQTPAPTPPRPAAATSGIDTGFNMGAQLGDSSVGAVMGYQFTKMYGMEIIYDYFDPIRTQATNETIAEKNRLGVSGLAMFPLKFSDMGPMAVFVKVGYARTTDKFTINAPAVGAIAPSTVITTTTKTGVTAGYGIHVDISEKSSVRLGFNVVGEDRTRFLVGLYRF